MMAAGGPAKARAAAALATYSEPHRQVPITGHSAAQPARARKTGRSDSGHVAPLRAAPRRTELPSITFYLDDF